MLCTALFAAAVSAQMTDPIKLIADEAPSHVSLTVLGDSPIALHASYELEASAGQGNRSVQRGQVDLVPGKPVKLISLNLGGTTHAWTAKLTVVTSFGTYEQVRGKGR